MKNSKTEKFLFATLSIAIFLLVFSFFNNDPVSPNVVSAESEEGRSENFSDSENSKDLENDEDSKDSKDSEDLEDSKDSKNSKDSEDSKDSKDPEDSNEQEDSENSENSEDQEDLEDSEDQEDLEDSEVSEDSMALQKNTTAAQHNNTAEKSEKSVESVDNEKSEKSKTSEGSVTSVEGYDEVVSVEGNKAIVIKQEKFLGIFNIDIESEIMLDEKGEVISEKKNFINWLQDLFSF